MQGDAKSTKNSFRFVVHDKHIRMSDYDSKYFVYTKVPLCNIIHHLSVKAILNIVCVHGIKILSHIPKAIMVNIFDAHHCATCNDVITIFSVVRSKLVHERNWKQKAMDSVYIEPEMTGGTGDSCYVPGHLAHIFIFFLARYVLIWSHDPDSHDHLLVQQSHLVGNFIVPSFRTFPIVLFLW